MTQFSASIAWTTGRAITTTAVTPWSTGQAISQILIINILYQADAPTKSEEHYSMVETSTQYKAYGCCRSWLPKYLIERRILFLSLIIDLLMEVHSERWYSFVYDPTGCFNQWSTIMQNPWQAQAPAVPVTVLLACYASALATRLH